MPKHSLIRLTQKLHGVPHLINQQSFRSITTYLNSRNANLMTLPLDTAGEGDAEDEEPDDLDDINGIGIITISGPLTNRPTGFEMMCGGTSYESIIEQADDFIDAGATCIVLNMDSGGGEAYGVFLAADQLRAMCDEANIPLLGYIDGTAASACYALACVCDEVIANPFSEIGSVGVLIHLQDDSKADEMAGIKDVYISAGDQKIPYSSDGSFKPEFIDDLQAKVNVIHDAFCTHVSTYTGLSVEDVKATQARTFMAQDALKVGFINKIMTNMEFVQYVADIQGREGVSDE